MTIDAAAAATGDPGMDLVIETDAGVFVRRIRGASLLPGAADQGTEAETATRLAAAHFGLPDLVFRPGSRRRGRALRELGDALLFAGERAASVQVKARVAISDDPTREQRWLDKRVAEASSQSAGTVRALLTKASVDLTNERGRTVSISTGNLSWVHVVVLDHPGVDGYVPAGPAIALLRRDWEFLFEQLKSTYAVVEYLHRIKDDAPVELGQEPVRYYEFAAADEATPQGVPDARLVPFGFTNPTSRPLLPRAPAGHQEDLDHAIIRIILEDLAVTGSIDENHRLTLLAGIDAIPVAYRAELGRVVVDWLRDVAKVKPPALTWRFRDMPFTGRPFLIVGAASRFTDTVYAAFGGFVSLRHQQLADAMPERLEMLTIGILLTPRTDGLRPWDTTSVATRGDQAFEAEYRAQLEDLWGPLGSSQLANGGAAS